MSFPYQFTVSQVMGFASLDPIAAGTLQPGSFTLHTPDPAAELRDARALGAAHAEAGYDPDCTPDEAGDPMAAEYLRGYHEAASARSAA